MPVSHYGPVKEIGKPDLEWRHNSLSMLPINQLKKPLSILHASMVMQTVPMFIELVIQQLQQL
jgi:hypothetical protein